jgi:myotubularin-related protein 6/7/8
LFCFKYFKSFFEEDKNFNNKNWYLFDIKNEFERLNFSKNNLWRISQINKDFKISKSYPEYIITPFNFDDEKLIKASNFRSKNRMISIVWNFEKFNIVICRAAQPKTSITKNRNFDDENLIQEILKNNKNNQNFYIFDSRPYLNALANLFNGHGN